MPKGTATMSTEWTARLTMPGLRLLGASAPARAGAGAGGSGAAGGCWLLLAASSAAVATGLLALASFLPIARRLRAGGRAGLAGRRLAGRIVRHAGCGPAWQPQTATATASRPCVRCQAAGVTPAAPSRCAESKLWRVWVCTRRAKQRGTRGS